MCFLGIGQNSSFKIEGHGLVYGCPLRILCVPSDFYWRGLWLVWAWGSGALCWDWPGGMSTAELGMGQGGPRTLCIECALSGQLKLK